MDDRDTCRHCGEPIYRPEGLSYWMHTAGRIPCREMRAEPQGDGLMREHNTESDSCWCNPQSVPVKREDGSVGWVVVHNKESE